MKKATEISTETDQHPRSVKPGVHAELSSLTLHATTSVPGTDIILGTAGHNRSMTATSSIAATAVKPDRVVMSGATAKSHLTASVAEMRAMNVIKVNNHQRLMH